MGSTNPLSSYSLLKMKMKKIESSKKNEIKKGTEKSDPDCSTSKSTLPSKSTEDMISNKSFNKQKEFSKSSEKEVVDPDVPDHSFGDFYCRICDSHMNSQGMWDSHVTGKKHLKNVKKSVPDTKYEDLDVESSLKYEIRNVKDAIVGLSYVQEVRRKEPGVPSIFTCFLCHANCATAAMVIEHVISLKHRLNYIKENSPDDHELLEATDLKKGQMEPLVAEMAHKLEEKFGSGTVKVKQEKSKPPLWPPKQPITHRDDNKYDDDDDDDDVKVDRIKKPHNKKPHVWKPFDLHKRDSLKDVKDCRTIIEERRKRLYSSDEEEDLYIRKDPMKRTAYYSHSKRQRPSSPPYLQESPKMEKSHSRTANHAFSEHHYNSYSRSSPQEFLEKNVHNSRNSTYSPLHEHSLSRSHVERQESSSNNRSLPNQATSNEDESGFDVLKDFVQKVYALPPEIFLKIVLLKLENIEVKEVDLSLLSKVINKALAIFSNKLPPDVESLVREKMFRNADSGLQRTATPPEINQISKSDTENKCSQSGHDFISNLINQAKAKNPTPSVTSLEASHYSAMSYSAPTHVNVNPSYQSNYVPPSNEIQSYNSASYSATSAIPGLTLTEDNRQAHPSSYNAYHQSQYSHPSSANYPQYNF